MDDKKFQILYQYALGAHVAVEVLEAKVNTLIEILENAGINDFETKYQYGFHRHYEATRKNNNTALHKLRGNVVYPPPDVDCIP